jgi:glutaredoxin 3
MKVEIYSKDACPYCDAAIYEAKSRELDFTVKKLGVDYEREQLLETFPDARTFPQIIVDGEKIGGYTQFMEILKSS